MLMTPLEIYLDDFVKTDRGTEKELEAMCANYVFAPESEGCCVSFDLDPRFAELAKFNAERAINNKCAQVADVLRETAESCKAAGKPEKAAIAYRVALTYLKQGKAEGSKLYHVLEEKLNAL